MKPKSYSGLLILPTFRERFDYLKLDGRVGADTFGFDRYLNQRFYMSKEWRTFRSKVIARDEGCDLGIADRPIQGRVIIHHIIPLTVEDFEEQTDALFDMDNVICVAPMTHEAIHFGDYSLLPQELVERTPNDTCPWR